MPVRPPASTILALTCIAPLLACKPELPTESPTAAPAPACGVEDFEQVWTPERRAKLEDALASVPGEWPQQTLTTIDSRIAERRGPWLNTYASACASADQAAQRCLDHQRWQLDAVVTVLTEHPDHASALWADIDNLLVNADACLGTKEPSFDAPALSPASGRGLAQMRLLLNLGNGVANDPIGPELAALLRSLALDELVRDTPAYAMPVYATVAAIDGASIDASEAALLVATEAATHLGPRAQMSLGHVRAALAFRQSDVEDGLRALDEALAAAREQPDPWLLFASLRNTGRVRLELGDHVGAIAPLTEAISLSTRLAGSENPHTAEVQLALARAQLAQGQIESAHDLLMQARDSFVNTLGPDHPETLRTVEQVGEVLLAAGRPLEANRAFLDLLEINDTLYGPKDWRTARIKLELGETLMAMDQHQSARAMYLEALTPLVQTLGPEHRDVIRTVVHLGYAELALGNLEEAQTHCSRGADLAKGLAVGDALGSEAKQCLEELALRSKPGKKSR